MQLELLIESYGPQLAFELFAPSPSVSSGMTMTTPGNATLVLGEMYGWKSVGAHEVITLVLRAGGDVGVGLLSAWLYDKLKGRAKSLRINRRVVEIEEGLIRRVIEEHVEAGPEV